MPNPYTYTTFNNSLWLLLFSHNTSYQEWFNDEFEALHFDFPDKPYKYSILSILYSLPKINGIYEFVIDYQNFRPGSYIQWAQSMNPIERTEESTNGKADGYVYKGGVNDSSFGGLARTSYLVPDCLPCFLDGHISSGSWHYSIGMYPQETCNGGWNHSIHPSGRVYGSKKVSLWVKVKNKLDCPTVLQARFLMHKLFFAHFLCIECN